MTNLVTMDLAKARGAELQREALDRREAKLARQHTHDRPAPINVGPVAAFLGFVSALVPHDTRLTRV